MRHLSLVPPVTAEDASSSASVSEPVQADGYRAPTPEEIAQALAQGEDAGGLAQRLAEAHLDACQEAEWAAEEGAEQVPDSPACAPFCSCETCVVREVLYAAWPVIEASVRLELEREAAEAAEQG